MSICARFHLLGRLGYIETYRGKSGGFELKADAAQINIGGVIEATEPRQPVIDCGAQPCILISACALQSALNKAEQAFYETLNTYSLADVLKNLRTCDILVRQVDRKSGVGLKNESDN